MNQDEGDVETCDNCGVVLVAELIGPGPDTELVCPVCKMCDTCGEAMTADEVYSGKDNCMSCFSESMGD